MNEKRILIAKSDLTAAANSGAMAPQDVETLWTALEATSRSPQERSFDIAQLFWYAGGALVMLAMGWFMERAWEAHSLYAVLALSLGYTAAFAGLGYKLRFQSGFRIPGAVLYLLAVLMTPFTVSALLEITHLNLELMGEKSALLIEGATLLVALLVLRTVRVSLLTAPVFGTLWLLSMTAAALITGQHGLFFGIGGDNFEFVSMTIGAAILALAFFVDLNWGRDEEDYSWWGYLFGTAAFWIPLSMLDSGSELGKFLYFLLNIGLMISSVVLSRRVLLLAGALGSVGYVGHLIWTFFSGSLALPLVLIVAGLAVIYLGLQYRRHQADIERMVLDLVPEPVRKRLPGRRA